VTLASPLPQTGDLITLLYLFAVARFFFALAGLDTGSPFTALGASREALLGVLVEPMLLLGLWVTAQIASSTHISQLAATVYHWPLDHSLPLLLALWETLTAKLGALPPPFFAPPQSLIDVVHEDWQRLGLSTLYSLRLLLNGIVFGAVIGFLTGVWIGWSRIAGYWVHPLLRFLGPVPASALLPLAFFFAPSSYSAAVFLVALATFFPVAVLTWSGVASVSKSYYDVARTLGASPWFLVLRVAIPAALPQVFVGLFMGLGASFSVLITAEMMGVKAGLGWYLQWAQGWAAYANMYTALLVMAVLCSGLITLLFTVRDRTLSWQKGTVKW